MNNDTDLIHGKKKVYYTNIALLMALTLSALDNLLRDLGIAGLGVLKNVFLFIYIMLAVEKIINKKTTLIFTKELKSIVLLTMIFFLLSCYYMFVNNGVFLGTIGSLMKLMLPCIVAFCIINTNETVKIYGLMEAYLYISFVLYILMIILSGNLTFATISSISLLDSFSNPFESNFFSPCAIALVIFFSYYDKKRINLYLSLLFTLMTFKRLFIVYAIFLYVFSYFLKRVSRMRGWHLFLFICAFSGFIFLFVALLSQHFDVLLIKYFGVGINQVTSTRSSLYLDLTWKNLFVSHGMGSAAVYKRSIEMDYPTFLLEMGVLSIISAVAIFTSLCGRNVYLFIMVVFINLELLTSHFYDITYMWILFYVTIGCVLYKNDNRLQSRNWLLWLRPKLIKFKR